MALARVVSFEGVSAERMAQLTAQIEGEGRPEEIPATEIVALHDPDGEKSIVILFFDSEDDYRKGDEALNAMSADETPGRRAAVEKYTVAARMTA